MKNIKQIILLGFIFIVTLIFISNSAFAAFSTSDLEGTWYGHGLMPQSGNNGAWVYNTITIDNQGNLTAHNTESDGSTDTASGTMSITSGGIITFVENPSVHGVMNSDKNVVVFTASYDPGEYAMQVVIKQSGTFSQSDLTGTWYVHQLDAVDDWTYGTVTVDSSGNWSFTGQNSDNESPTDSGTIAITPGGIVTLGGQPSSHGAMSSDKKMIAMTITFGTDHVLAVFNKGVGSFTLPDLEGLWYGHTLCVGDWYGWEYSTITIDDSGHASGPITDSDGGAGSVSATLSIAGNGEITTTDNITTHGVLSLGKNIMAFTETGTTTNEYRMSVIVKASPVADFSATPLTGNKPLEVFFTDSSTGEISSWSWDFGDGSTSTEQNSSHTYSDKGKYSVSLTVTGSEGSDVETKTNYIDVKSPGMSWLPILLDE